MHPALSIILFTVASGAGYGLLALAGAFAASGLLPDDPWFGLAALALALAGIGTGLVSSTGHLGRPERAWRALSQWRSSWLSREGVAALASLVPAALLGLALLEGWRDPALMLALGLLTVMLAVVTVACTAMIYRSLRPIRQWHHGLVLPNYLALALMTGALWFAALATLWGERVAPALGIALVAIALAAALKLAYWSAIDRAPATLTAEAATGLLGGGAVRLFEAPHSQDNYLLKEMGFRIARKHAAKLRRIALAAGFVLPFLLVAAAALSSVLAAPAAILAALSGTAGVLVERWLFFAEAKHTVMLYYGAASV
ncbi:MAG: dimethyl sulfoxide reductase anchor subunit family protein [Stellaceae bacterium]